MKRILLLAFALYLFVAPLTYHPDNKLVLQWASFEQGAVWNIYHFQDLHPEVNAKFNYPPIHYFLAKAQYSIGSLVGGPEFTNWLQTSNEADAFEPNLMRYMLSTKLVLLLSSLAVGAMLYLLVKRVTDNSRQARLAAILWLFNPVVLYSVVMMGQNDVLAILLFLMGWYLCTGKKWLASPILFALSIGVKFYPLLWIIMVLAAAADQSLKKRITVLAGTIALSVAIMAPYLSSLAFRTNVLQSSINDRFLVPQIQFGFDEAVYVIPLLLTVAFGLTLSFSKKQNHPTVFYRQAAAVLVTNAVLLGFSHFHPQWFTWLIPFWAIVIAMVGGFSRRMKIVSFSLLTLASWLGVIVFFKDVYLNWGIFTPLRGDVLFLPQLYDLLLSRGFDVSRLVNTLHTMLAGIAIISFALLTHVYEGSHAVLVETRSTAKFYFSSKLFGIFFATVTPVLLVFLSMMLFQILPIPIVTQPVNQPIYRRLAPSQTSMYQAPARASIRRIDLAFRNPNLLSTQEISLLVQGKMGDTLQSIPFSGSNVGDCSLLRFDLSPIIDADAEYSLQLMTPESSASAVLLGMISDGSTSSFWARTYSRSISPFTTAIQATQGTTLRLASSMWGWWLTIAAALYLLTRKSTE